MDTCSKVSRYLENALSLPRDGHPKTIDNDLVGTDHCRLRQRRNISPPPLQRYTGYPRVRRGNITVVEIMGRHAGWLAGAASLASISCAPPDLIYLPEVDFDLEKFIGDVTKIYKEKGKCLVAVSEGIHYADGTFVSEAKASSTDGFGHAQLGGLAVRLAELIKQRTGSKVRGIELSLLQRCAAHLASQTDIDEAFKAGKYAVECALKGETGKMVAFERDMSGGSYACKMILQPLSVVANAEEGPAGMDYPGGK